MPFGYVISTGCNHMSLNRGALFLVKLDSKGPPQAKLWKVLPGTPSYSVLAGDGRLLLRAGGVELEVTAEGTLQMASDLR